MKPFGQCVKKCEPSLVGFAVLQCEGGLTGKIRKLCLTDRLRIRPAKRANVSFDSKNLAMYHINCCT